MRGDDDLGLKRYPNIFEFFLLPIRAFASSSYIMIFIFFFSISFLRKTVFFNLIAIIGSLPVVLIGILGIDRSKSFYWIIILGLSMVFFWKYIDRNKKIKIIPILSTFMLLIVIYVAMVTNSRFGERDTGNKGGVITYAGQSYINFCYFWDNFENPDGLSTKYLFPATHHWIIGDYKGTVPYQQELHLKTRKNPGVFYSYLGSFLVDSNKPGPLLFSILYLLLCRFAFRKKKDIIRHERLFYIFLLLIIPACGTILYIYTSYYMTFSIVLWIILLKFLDRGKREVLYADVTNSKD
jgi:oligosaccharide repeat unit polymerase